MHILTIFLAYPMPCLGKKTVSLSRREGKTNKIMEREMVLNVKNKRTHVAEIGKVDVYCGRGSVLGNPFSHKEGTKAKFVVESRDEAIEAYRLYFKTQMETNTEFLNEMRRIYRIARKQEVNLICYCAPLPCHCNVIRGFMLSF